MALIVLGSLMEIIVCMIIILAVSLMVEEVVFLNRHGGSETTAYNNHLMDVGIHHGLDDRDHLLCRMQYCSQSWLLVKAVSGLEGLLNRR